MIKYFVTDLAKTNITTKQVDRETFMESLEYNLDVANEYKEITNKEYNRIKQWTRKNKPFTITANGFEFELSKGQLR